MCPCLARRLGQGRGVVEVLPEMGALPEVAILLMVVTTPEMVADKPPTRWQQWAGGQAPLTQQPSGAIEG